MINLSNATFCLTSYINWIVMVSLKTWVNTVTRRKLTPSAFITSAYLHCSGLSCIIISLRFSFWLDVSLFSFHPPYSSLQRFLYDESLLPRHKGMLFSLHAKSPHDKVGEIETRNVGIPRGDICRDWNSLFFTLLKGGSTQQKIQPNSMRESGGHRYNYLWSIYSLTGLKWVKLKLVFSILTLFNAF